MYDPIALRIAARYLRATEFPTEKARKDYLREHPGADPSKHTVREEQASKKAQSWLSRAGQDIKSFFSDPKARRESFSKAAEHLKAAPRAAGLNVIQGVKKQIKDAQVAFDGLKTVMNGGTLSEEHKTALKKVAIKATTALVASALVSAFPASIASGIVGKQIAQHVTKTVMARAIGTMTGVKLATLLQGAPEGWLGDMLARNVAEALDNLSDDDIRDILEASAEGDEAV